MGYQAESQEFQAEYQELEAELMEIPHFRKGRVKGEKERNRVSDPSLPTHPPGVKRERCICDP